MAAIGPAEAKAKRPRPLRRLGRTNDAQAANDVAFGLARQGLDATADPTVPIRPARVAVSDATAIDRAGSVNTFGAVLYRARLPGGTRYAGWKKEIIRLHGEQSLPQDCAFLAAARFRLRHRDEARRRLDRLREHQPSGDAARFWDELEGRLLRSGAEAGAVKSCP